MTTKDAVNPSHYKDGWSDDAELISVTENLTSNGGQAVQYVARATRLDKSKNKGKTTKALIEDLEKAQWFLAREVKRLKALPVTDANIALDFRPKAAGQVNYYDIRTSPDYYAYMNGIR